MAARPVVMIVGRIEAAEQQTVRLQRPAKALDELDGLLPREIMQRQAGDDHARALERERGAEILAVEPGGWHALAGLRGGPAFNGCTDQATTGGRQAFAVAARAA